MKQKQVLKGFIAIILILSFFVPSTSVIATVSSELEETTKEQSIEYEDSEFYLTPYVFFIDIKSRPATPPKTVDFVEAPTANAERIAFNTTIIYEELAGSTSTKVFSIDVSDSSSITVGSIRNSVTKPSYTDSEISKNFCKKFFRLAK